MGGFGQSAQQPPSSRSATAARDRRWRGSTCPDERYSLGALMWSSGTGLSSRAGGSPASSTDCQAVSHHAVGCLTITPLLGRKEVCDSNGLPSAPSTTYDVSPGIR